MNNAVWKVWKTLLKNGEKPVSVGKEVSIELKTGEQVVLVCEQVKNGRATFFTKDLLKDTHCMNENWALGNDEVVSISSMDDYLKRVFRILPDDLQSVICDRRLRLLTEREVCGTNIFGKEDRRGQLPRYKELGNRIKHLDGIPFPYWLQNQSVDTNRCGYFCSIDEDGYATNEVGWMGYGVCFGFEI